jgi:hypothetical protein
MMQSKIGRLIVPPLTSSSGSCQVTIVRFACVHDSIRSR